VKEMNKTTEIKEKKEIVRETKNMCPLPGNLRFCIP
jgi:hypothetical protein